MAIEVDEENFGLENGVEVPRQQREFRILHMKPEQRLPVYLAIIGLMKAGYALDVAAQMIANEYNLNDDRQAMQSKAVIQFFSGVLSLSNGDEVVKLAVATFGKPFLFAEERALLRGLIDGDTVEILSAAADVLRNMDLGSGVRTSR